MDYRNVAFAGFLYREIQRGDIGRNHRVRIVGLDEDGAVDERMIIHRRDSTVQETEGRRA